ncbi:glycosyltransferase [Amphibacillus jilinensis]|uniref:glycosyltransferase n=1 Tax=Amphibacillus jilinensis TaxID=1216008 RepID=UPI0002E1FB08|nr:glycosyltransferase [Amphibacillus jilinensis]
MSNKEKVVHLTTVHHPFDTRVYHKECLSLHRAGYNVTLVAPFEDQVTGQQTVTDEGIQVIATKKRNNRFTRMLLSTWQTYKLAKAEKASYYHFHDPELIWVGWLLKNKTNHVVYDIHEDYYTSIMQKDYLWSSIRKLVGALYNKIEKFFIKKFNLILAEKYYQERYPKGQTVLNYPMINQQLLNHDQIDHKPDHALIYTGNVTEVRGAFLHANIPNLPSHPMIHFIGKCDQGLANKMEQIAGEYKEHLFFNGINQFVDRKDIDQAYISRTWLAGVAIFPPTEHYMRKELTKFFEYMSAGIPIICSNFPVWQAFIEKYKCGLTVDPNNPEDWQRAINYLIDNEQERQAMAYNGRTAIVEELNWAVEEDKLINWYQQLKL